MDGGGEDELYNNHTHVIHLKLYEQCPRLWLMHSSRVRTVFVSITSCIMEEISQVLSKGEHRRWVETHHEARWETLNYFGEETTVLKPDDDSFKV